VIPKHAAYTHPSTKRAEVICVVAASGKDFHSPNTFRAYEVREAAIVGGRYQLFGYDDGFGDISTVTGGFIET
jgi:hypothetical protein